MDIGATYPSFDKPEYDGLITALEESDIKTHELLYITEQALSRRCGRSITEVRRFLSDFLDHVKSQCSPDDIKLSDIYQPSHIEGSIFTTGDKGMDQLLNGGIRTKTITEFVGEAGCGKSHILTQIAFTVQLQPEEGGLGRAAIYVSTESPLPKVRLDDMERSTGGSQEALLVFKCRTFAEMQQTLLINVPRAVEQFDVGLVVIDSIAQPFREMNMKDTTKNVEFLAQRLKASARKLNFAVVVANQVTSVFATRFTIEVEKMPMQYDYQSRFHSGWSRNTVYWRSIEKKHENSKRADTKIPPSSSAGSFQGGKRGNTALRPYCGPAWSAAVDVRVAVKRAYDRSRTMKLVYSPWAPSKLRDFEIIQEGVRVEMPLDSEE